MGFQIRAMLILRIYDILGREVQTLVDKEQRSQLLIILFGIQKTILAIMFQAGCIYIKLLHIQMVEESS